MPPDYGRGIFWTTSNGGHWFINDRELLFEAVRNPGLFSSTAMTIPIIPASLSVTDGTDLAQRFPGGCGANRGRVS